MSRYFEVKSDVGFACWGSWGEASRISMLIHILGSNKQGGGGGADEAVISITLSHRICQ